MSNFTPQPTARSNPNPWSFISPAGTHQEGHRANKKRFSDIVKNGLHWQRKRLPTPGAQNYAFETLALFETTPIGPAVAQRKFFKVLQPQQIYFGGITVPITGLGGLAAGQYVMQPLVDPYNNTYGGIPIAGGLPSGIPDNLY